MESKLEITKNTEKNIRDLAKALKEVGLDEFADGYFKDDRFDNKYFKILKPFAKEDDDDPDIETLFIDVSSEEYTVHTRLGHEHYSDAKTTATMVKGLFDGTLAEVALCFPNITARFLVANTGDAKKNVDIIYNNADSIMEIINDSISVLNTSAHIHRYFEAAFPNYLQILPKENYMFDDSEVYMQSVVMGTHPEIYL